MLRLILSAVLVLVAVAPTHAQDRSVDRPVILIGIDGFRADYLDRGVTPVLSRLATEGAWAEVMDRVWWDDAEPIWVSAEAAGVTTATLFWPGSEAAVHGVRPTYWLPFEQSLSSQGRVNMVLAWMRLPPFINPAATS